MLGHQRTKADAAGPGQLQSISAVSTVNAKGAFWFVTYKGVMTDELLVELFKKLMKNRKKPLHLILDGLPAQKTWVVQDYVASKQGKLILHFCRAMHLN